MDSLHAWFLTKQPIVEQVGNRIYPVRAPAGMNEPFAVYIRSDREERPSFQGATGGIVRTVLDITVWADTHARADLISEVFREQIDGFKGGIGPGDIDKVYQLLVLDQADDYAEDPNGREFGWYGVRTNYSFWYGQSIPAPAIQNQLSA